MSFKEFYNIELKKKLKDELKLVNVMEVPNIKKIVVNVGAGEAVTDKKVLEKIQEHLNLITGQKSVITKARKSVSAFKIRKGLPIGVKVTLRDKRMFNFLEKLIKIVIPRLRDFKGINANSIDDHGNLNIGFSEQTIFPEIEFDKIDKIRGLEVTIVTNARDKVKGKKLFEILGIPFQK
ncbi:50S ribosomal protein L5 [Candidatus Roizmanbacteria bacterium RIFCSPHIGHO2_01_FULL_35_10]|uniref:Large ribosomal subunit protein uL5 n=1 Tax=Candidatus Roizmanbacteria bacterium RIFCSPLOWO2_01_FULL_35_13 TaxID=1802055 RepID=A0A1F7IAS3_9BACT|nr:MAG: 50S ribosomal protein L5 [Candidatus Roizmanbacteria bacterium RIFCSPHIGHO2_01_FULL_35_10]OGK40448.1 MAG: 50S ribosomal protein L5 [Candidatus Roizmanbacteria bacterium RIFCSPLOWO2_01_FULL_35_13]